MTVRALFSDRVPALMPLLAAVCALVVGATPGTTAAATEDAAAGATPGAGDALLTAGPTEIPLSHSGAGSLQVTVTIADEQAAFVLDTGAALVSINRGLASRLQARGALTESRQVAVRLADGRLKRVSVQRVSSLTLGAGCELRDVEVLVLPGEGRNLLGLNALTAFAPLTLQMLPPSLGLSRCMQAPQVVSY
jgi:clan AA aspartic protease (TIGR02281 family)